MIDLDLKSQSDVNFRKFDNQTSYVSVVVTYVNSLIQPEAKRWELLEKCVDSIHRHADYAFELTLLDDSGLDLTSLNVKEKVSTLILNMGKPLKQNTQLNRGINVSSSKYIIVIEDDVEIKRPCFKDLVHILDKPYVGFLNSDGLEATEYLINEGTKFCVGGRLAGSWFIAFRKDVWNEVGGFPEWAHATGPPFCHKTFQFGYWRGYLVGEHFARNMDVEDYQSQRSTRLVGLLGHNPKLFYMPPEQQLDNSSKRHELSVKNFNACRFVSGSVSNTDYWRDYCDAVTPNLKGGCISSINWEAAKGHGQDKWKDAILSEEVHHP